MGHLIRPSGIGKAQLTHLIEAIMRTFREHDETEYKKLADKERLSALRRERVPYYVERKNLYEEGIKNFPFYISRGEEGVEWDKISSNAIDFS